MQKSIDVVAFLSSVDLAELRQIIWEMQETEKEAS
jgi:hypothetical protein